MRKQSTFGSVGVVKYFLTGGVKQHKVLLASFTCCSVKRPGSVSLYVDVGCDITSVQCFWHLFSLFWWMLFEKCVLKEMGVYQDLCCVVAAHLSGYKLYSSPKI